jgi:predicted RNase H-like HicB family nuclease
MKELSQSTVCVIDYGTFLDLAVKLSEKFKRVLYYSPHETEYQDVKQCVIGTGIPTVERVDDFLDYLGEIDGFIFTDIAHGGLQRYLRSIGKPVWGSFGGTDLELYRTRFQDMLAEVGLPVAPTKKVVGMKALEIMLKAEKDKWIKVNRFRANIETWHHIDYEHSVPMLNYMRDEFGGVSDKVVFVVQDPIPEAQEVGYDGFSVDGKYPNKSFQGYEKKNELYLGSWLPNEEMPEIVTRVNEAIAPVLRDLGYRNCVATEIRDEFFIDITPRHAGQTQEHLQETCTNWAEVIWAGAHGALLEPEFASKFAAEATLHYTGCDEDWKVLRIDDKAKKWFRLTGYCQDGDMYHFPPGKNDEVGVVIGNGDTIEEAIDNLKEHLELAKEEPIRASTNLFADLLIDIRKAQEAGVKFSNQAIPKPEVAIE